MNNKIKGTVFTLPEWTKRLPDDAYLSVAEVQSALGYKGVNKWMVKLKMKMLGVNARLSRNTRGTAIPRYNLADLRKVEGKVIN